MKLQEVADGFIVHQPDQERVHDLDYIAAMILLMCNGEDPLRPKMAEALRGLYDLPENAECRRSTDAARPAKEQGRLVT